jgi:bifunctional non-homologous end joining protein LigD
MVLIMLTHVTHALSRLGLDQSGSDPYPRRPVPMLLHKADVMFSAPDWTYEPKWDGFRVMAAARDGYVRLVSRNGHSFTRLFGPVAESLRDVPVSILLDGEAIVINDRGQPDFEALQSRLRPSHGSLPGNLCYMVFDCLYVNGHSLLTKPLEKRRAISGNCSANSGPTL